MKKLLKASLGLQECDFVLTNGKVVNVFTGEVMNASVYVYDGFIAHVEYQHPEVIDVPVREVIDCKGQFITPGFIDAHMHIESTMLTPRNFAKAAIPCGTTTVITDPHEIGNVLGVEGVRYMHDSSADLPMRQLIDAPSCVPAVPGKEFTGADFKADEIKEILALDRVIGLAEVMDFLAVIQGEDRMLEILNAAVEKGVYIQGHAPGLSGRMLSAYLCGGPNTDHESRIGAEALEKYRLGMHIDMRESSMTKNVKELWATLKNSRYFDTLCLCTDDVESDDLKTVGHINAVARLAISQGMNPIDAIKSCTINTAREIKMDRLGAIAPGYVADINVVPDLTELWPSMVFFEGRKVAENRKLLADIPDQFYPLEKRNTVTIRELSESDFILKAPIENGTVKVNLMHYPSHDASVTQKKTVELEVRDGRLIFPHDDMKFCAVLNRFGKDHIALAVVEGIGLKKGALASTVSHDSHNLTIVYDNPADALAAANCLKSCGGGLCSCENGEVLGVLPLPIAGLLSDKDANGTSAIAEKLKEIDRSLGLTDIPNPLLRIAVLALPVIPEIKMTDCGMMEVVTKKYVPNFPEYTDK